MHGVKAKALKGGLYSLEGTVSRRIKPASRRERDLKAIIQENPGLIPNTKDVTWIGREFHNADFFGIDKSGYIVICEAKVKSTPTKVVEQMNGQWKYFSKLTLSQLAKLIDGYVKNPKKKKYFMRAARELRKRQKDGKWLLFKKTKTRSGKIIGVKFITITPTVSQPIFRRFVQMQTPATKVRKKARADSGACRPPIPEHAVHPFRAMPTTHSGACRPPVPEHADHLIGACNDAG